MPLTIDGVLGPKSVHFLLLGWTRINKDVLRSVDLRWLFDLVLHSSLNVLVFFWPGQNCCFSHRARKICMDFGPINSNFFCGHPADSFLYNAKSTWRNAGDESERYHVTNFKIFSVGVIQRFQRAAAKIVNIDCYTTVRSILRPITINRKIRNICVWMNWSLL